MEGGGGCIHHLGEGQIAGRRYVRSGTCGVSDCVVERGDLTRDTVQGEKSGKKGP